MASARPPAASMPLALATTFATVRPASATLAPAAASACAMPCPTPCPAPVTSATLPDRSAMRLRSGTCRRRYARQPVRGELWRLNEGLDLLVQPFVHRLGDTPLALALHVLVAIERAASGAHLVGEIDEDVGQVPDAGRRAVGKHVDLGVMPGMAGDRVGIERAGDRFEDLLASVHLPAVTATDVVDLDVLGEHVAHAGDVTGVQATPVAVLQAADEFDIFQT